MKFKTPFNNQVSNTRYETNSGISETIPDQTMTIREMLQRHSKGLPLEGVKVPIYEGTQSPFLGKDPRTLDLSEIAEMRDEALDREKVKLTKAQERKKQDEQVRYNNEVKKAASELLAAQNNKKEGDQPS